MSARFCCVGCGLSDWGLCRLGTCALTSREFTAAQFDEVAEFLHRGIKIGTDAVAKAGKNLKEVCPLCFVVFCLIGLLAVESCRAG